MMVRVKKRVQVNGTVFRPGDVVDVIRVQHGKVPREVGYWVRHPDTGVVLKLFAVEVELLGEQ